jgi:hypothetical protein
MADTAKRRVAAGLPRFPGGAVWVFLSRLVVLLVSLETSGTRRASSSYAAGYIYGIGQRHQPIPSYVPCYIRVAQGG